MEVEGTGKEMEAKGKSDEPGRISPRPEEYRMSAARPSSLALGLILLLVCAFVWIETGSYPEDLLDARKITGPGTFPRLLSAIAGLISVREIFRSLRDGKVESSGAGAKRVDWSKAASAPGNRNIFVVVLMTALFIPLTDWLGFSVGAAVYTLLLMARLKAKPLQAVVCSVLAIAFIVFLFSYVFRVQLPVGILTEPLGWRY